jgi:hypothetical protein
MFEIETLYGEIKINDNFLGKVKKWLDNNDDYIKQAYKQVIQWNTFLNSNQSI